MKVQLTSILKDPEVRRALQQAWYKSNPGSSGGHEEGGFVVLDTGILRVMFWPRGSTNTIRVPDHANCRIDSYNIVASFHTHPNTDDDYFQEPSETDIRAVRDDIHLKGEQYLGEIVISQSTVYLIRPNGQVRELGDTHEILELE